MEERPTWTDDGARVDVDTSTPNPNGLEFDNLFLDMNGIIHPASHPEDRPPPETEDDMYLAIFDYLERVFAAKQRLKADGRADVTVSVSYLQIYCEVVLDLLLEVCVPHYY